jgi:hypothetical protein
LHNGADTGAAGWIGAKEAGEEAAPSGPPLDEASVPAANSVVRASGRTMVRISLGVMRRTISVLTMVSLVDENRRPSTGKSPRPGTRVALRRSSSLMRPARIWVSPSRRRSTVLVLRVPIW